MLAHTLLGVSIGLEICATYMLSRSNGFTRAPYAIASMCLYFLCFFIFSKTLRYLNLGVAYAIWSGIGLTATSIIGWIAFGQKLNAIGILCTALIIVGCVGLDMFGTK